jgi:hypothetical protein
VALLAGGYDSGRGVKPDDRRTVVPRSSSASRCSCARPLRSIRVFRGCEDGGRMRAWLRHRTESMRARMFTQVSNRIPQPRAEAADPFSGAGGRLLSVGTADVCGCGSSRAKRPPHTRISSIGGNSRARRRMSGSCLGRWAWPRLGWPVQMCRCTRMVSTVAMSHWLSTRRATQQITVPRPSVRAGCRR